MFASPVLTNIKGFSYITVIVSHQWEKSNLVQSHAILNHMWLGQFYDMLPILKLPVGLQFNVWAAKRQRHHCFCRRVVFRQESYQWKGLKQLGSTCDSTSPRRSSSHISECFQKSRLEGLCSSYFQVALQLVVLVDLDFRFAQNHTLSLWRPLSASVAFDRLHDLRRIGSKRSCPPVVSGQ